MSIMLPVTLSSAAAAAIINIWLMIRVGQVRTSEKVSVGDGGNEKVIRRMRAHGNFVESAPFVVLLVGVIELAGKGQPWLAYVARSEEHTSELQSLMRISYAVFCLKKKK